MFLCTRPTESGRAEPLESRYCWLHSPHQLEHLKKMGGKARARNSPVGKSTKAGVAPRIAATASCSLGGDTCAFGPSWCPYTRRSHWFWVRTMKARCETWAKLIAGLASRVPFNPRFPVRF